MFRGVYEHHIDPKGRTSLPAKLRETLVGAYDERLIVTTALDPCLHAYPVREWEQLEASLATRNPMEPGVKTLMRLYVAPAQECALDKLGRMLIPPALRVPPSPPPVKHRSLTRRQPSAVAHSSVAPAAA